VAYCQDFWRRVVPDAYPSPRRPDVLIARRLTHGGRVSTNLGPRLHRPTLELVEGLCSDPLVDVILLKGSASLGIDYAGMDDDLEIVLNRAHPAAIGDFRRLALVCPGQGKGGIVCDATLTTSAALERRTHVDVDSERWPYEQARVLYALSTTTVSCVRALASMSSTFRDARLRHGYVDIQLAIYRGRQCQRDGRALERSVLAMRGAKALARTLFAIEWRWVPLDHWLSTSLLTLLDPSNCVSCLEHTIMQCSIEPLAVASDRLDSFLPSLLPSHVWSRDNLAQLAKSGGRRERLRHGLC
jgi:hypothetical protein